MKALSAHILDEIKALPARYPQPRSAAMKIGPEEASFRTPTLTFSAAPAGDDAIATVSAAASKATT